MHADSSWDALDLIWNKVPEEHTKVRLDERRAG